VKASRCGPEGQPEPYEPDSASSVSAQRLAEAAGGQAFDEDELDSASSAARQLVGEGETMVRIVATTDIDPLAPYVFLAALLPLGFLLYGRNLA
jgi:hypothetical protein